VVAAQCYEGETNLAYGPIITALRAALARPDFGQRLEGVPAHWLAETARVLPELGSLRPGLPPAPPLDNPGARSRFFEGLRQVLLAASEGTLSGVLYFDDVHWADGATLDLLTYLVRRLRERPVCLLLTWRSEQLSGIPRLRHLLAEAQRPGSAIVISLARLDPGTVGELARAATAGATLPAGLADRLYRETEGLPFFLVEYLAALAKGVLSASDDDWSLPGGARDLLRSRLEAVGETGWQALTTAAVIGRSFDFDILQAVSGRGEEETVGALEELITQGVVVEVPGDAGRGAPAYDFSHEKLRALVYDETSLARRRLLHRRVADALAARLRRPRGADTLPGQIAHHELLAGNEPAAAEYFRIAGERARALYANAEALAHFRMALALGHPDTASLNEAIGDLHTLLGEYAEALQSYETAAALAQADALAQLEHKLGGVHARRGEWELAESHFEAALATLGEADASGGRARIYADWSLTAHHRGQSALAEDLAGRALSLAEAAEDTRALAQAHNLLGILATSRRDLEGACRHLEHSLALAERLEDPGARAAALNNLALACGAGGDTARALALAESALALCVTQGDRHREAALHNNLADLLHASGRTDEAMAQLTQAVAIFAEIGAEAGTLQPEIWKLSEW
jgi:predicted ATPase